MFNLLAYDHISFRKSIVYLIINTQIPIITIAVTTDASNAKANASMCSTTDIL